MSEIEVPMNAARVCDAISRIGYEPHSALMDIVDNSVAAGGKHVRVAIELIDGKTINQRNNVARYVIVDDGDGMDEAGIVNAFRLGSLANYGPNSLSKYGMGLKSAGFSLGTRIQVISKKSGVITRKYFLDREIIEARQAYVVCHEDLTSDERVEFERQVSTSSGTIIEITGCGKIHHTSAKTTIDKLKHRLGVTYFSFLARPDPAERLRIELLVPGEAPFDIKPEDFLFTAEALPNFDPAEYSGALPCFAFKEEWKIKVGGDGEAAPIKLEVVTFPKDAMGGVGSPLSDAEKARIRKYKISRENKGFFVYRNGRLIRWGDSLDDIIGKDLIGFRARMELRTEHDDLLHVDVSKQRLEIDDESRKQLEVLMRIPKRQSLEVFAACDRKIQARSTEGVAFSATTDAVPEEDPVEDATPPDSAEKKKRAKAKEEESKATVSKLADTDEEQAPEPTIEKPFQKIRYTDELPGMNLWSAQKDPVQGTFVLINKRHAFYQAVLANFDGTSAQRLALEAIVFCCAVGENKTYENLTGIPDSQIREVLRRYHTVLSYNLGEWSAGNQNLFDA